MSDSKLVGDIKTLPKPSGFEQVDINYILGEYISIGMHRDDAAKFFKTEGFSSFVKNGGTLEEGEEIHWILYLDKELFTLAKYKVVIKIHLVDHRISGFSGVYLKNMY